MKRRLIKWCVLITAIVCICITACGCGNTAGEETEVKETDKENSETAASADNLLENYRIIYPKDSTKYVISDIEAFSFLVNYKYKVSVEAFPDTEPQTEYEIIIGKADREGADYDTAKIGYCSYGTRISGNKIFIDYTEEEYLSKALSILSNSLEEKEGKVFIIMESKYESTSPELKALPVYGDGTYDDILFCGENTYQVSVPVTSAEEYSSYLKKLEENGYKKHTDNTIGNNLFATYSNGTYEINAAYYGNGKISRIIIEPQGYLPDTVTPTYKKTNNVSITQMKLEKSGMSIVVTLEDGRFVIIDGGANSEEDANTLYKYLTDNTASGEKPHIIWIFTHAHIDHIMVPLKILRTHTDDIAVDMFVFNFPDMTVEAFENMSEKSSTIVNTQGYADSLALIAQTSFKDTPVFRCHPGQKLLLPGCEIEFLMTHENTGMKKYSWINSTSTVFRMTLGSGKKTALIMGDQEPASLCDTFYALYGDYLKSDILQVAHHGYSGGSLKLYTAVSPSVCFWPTIRESFDTPRRNGYNDDGTKIINEGQYFLRSKLEGVTHYDTGETVTIECP